ncbi:CHAP domain-containing protein [Spirochaeta thermophila]|uniref:Peptidase C51 domain-containing protein n=1 Tax=Winmispira thermophila (strain ATCC 49972 / DSM 6192 / RI 19.B1) TaxID=665571 RepID=E0RRD2_WINT6|nr:CHAP domain-containing protein [Spirochaeta thermophila]ADN03109.1 hypothetical protein STHERM_c21800 [Spirochaeta thermophila DSM 6192]
MRIRLHYLTAAILVQVLLFSACTTLPEGRSAWPDHGPRSLSSSYPDGRGPSLSELQRRLVEEARGLVGRERLVVKGRGFTMDCTGVVLAVYYAAGIDLSAEFSRYEGNGVRRLYLTMKSHGLLYFTRTPQPGDLIFWDDTYDANGDGRMNDPLTHVGMVVESHSDGTVVYIHHNYRRGIVLEYMNLYDPDTYTTEKGGRIVVVNSPMRMRGSPSSNGKWLASHLVRDFGRAYLYTN